MVLMRTFFAVIVVRVLPCFVLQSLKDENKKVEKSPDSWSSFFIDFPSLESCIFPPWV